MERTPVSSGKAYEQTNAHSPGVIASGRFLFTSGITPRDGAGRLVGAGDMAVQIEQVFANLEDVLKAAGAEFSDVIKFTIFVTDIDRFLSVRAGLRKEPGRVSERVMTGAPASTLIEVSRLADPEMMVEVEAIARLD